MGLPEGFNVVALWADFVSIITPVIEVAVLLATGGLILRMLRKCS